MDLKNKLFLIVGNLLFSLNNFFIIYLISVLFDQIILGEFTLALSVVVPLFTFADFQLRNYFIVNGFVKETFFTIFCLKSFFSIIASVISFVLFVIFSEANYIFIVSVVLLKIADTLYDILYGLHISLKKYNIFFKDNIVRTSVLIISLSVLMFFKENDINYFLILFSIINSFFATFYLIKILQFNFIKEFSRKEAKKILNDYGSFSIAVTINSYSSNIPKYFAQYYFGTAAQAGLSFYIAIAQGISRLISPIQNYYRSEMAVAYRQKNQFKLKSLFNKVIIIVGVFFVFCSFLLIWIKSLGLLKVEFSSFEILILLLSIFLSTIASITNTVLHAMNILTRQLKLSVILFLIMIIVNFIFSYFKISMSYVYLIDGLIMFLGFYFLFKNGLKKQKYIQ